MFRSHSAFALLLFGSSAFAGEPDPVVTAARGRQEKLQTVILEYRQVSHMTLSATATRPATESSTSADNRIVLNGNKVRVEDNNPGSGGGGFLRMSRIEVFNGEESWTYFPNGIGANATPEAIRHEKGPRIEPSLPEPIYLFFRGLDPAFRMYSVDQLVATERAEMIDGAKCPEYELRKQGWVGRYWFDPAKGFIVRRVQSERDGSVHRRTAITYRQDPDLGWVPGGWRDEILNADGTPKDVHECEITRLVVNGPVDPGEFHLVFKPGTHLDDQETKKKLLVLEDGNTREFTYAEMYGTRPRTTASQWIANNGWMLVLVASVVLLALVAILIRRRYRRTPPKWDQFLDEM